MLSTDDNDEVEKYFLDNLHNLSQIQLAWLYYWYKFGEANKKTMDSANVQARIFDNQQSRNSEDNPTWYFFFLILFFVHIRVEGFL